VTTTTTSKVLAFGAIVAVTAASLVGAAPPGSAAVSSAPARRYLVVFDRAAVPKDAGEMVARSGGAVAASYGPIGVVVATSTDARFVTAMRKRAEVEDVAATAAFATRLADGHPVTRSAGPPRVSPPTAFGAGDPLSGRQWDMDQIRAPEAHTIEEGSPTVTVGDIDSGLDFTHPDLAANIDMARSVSCVGGVANPDPAAWNDDNGHGTHTAGTIAAARNGLGIVGVAPRVRIAAIKTSDAAGLFLPEAVVCAFMWAGDHRLAVTNNSYFADPWLFNCRNDPGQRVIWNAERRAIRYAQSRGTVVVAALGNEADDLAHPTEDRTSPDNAVPVTRAIRNDCAQIPAEVPGVIGVAADGNLRRKSIYSNYGVGVTQLTAPGGDFLQTTAAAPNGLVLSTWPAALLDVSCPPGQRLVDPSGATYCYEQGTSMASPHVAGVAALVASRGAHPAGGIAAQLVNTARRLACPADPSIYALFPSQNNGAPQSCTGGLGNNSFSGHGEVDALAAISAARTQP
jgi:subtilisin family serine protease